MANRTINELLKDKFKAAKNVDALVNHFQHGVADYHQGKWENALGKHAKFLEAVLKALLAEACLPPQAGRQFKVDNAINSLGNLSSGTVDDSIRLSIPRACRFIYDITSNRGGRHDPDAIDANEMDATAILNICAWVLAEMVRYSQKLGDPSRAKIVVDGLMRRRYPFVEEIDGRAYFDLRSAKSARDLGLLILWHSGAAGISREELVHAIQRQKRSITLANARMAVTRLADLLDDDGSGNVRLRATGVREAEQLIDAADLC
jgi:hypothetical protein